MANQSMAIVTGATSMIGRSLISELIANDWVVYALVNPQSPRATNLEHLEGATIVPLAMSSYCSANIEAEMPGAVFFHIAWEGASGLNRFNPHLQSRNIEYTLGAVDLAKRLRCGTFIGIGSQAEYGRVSGVASPDTPCNPENAYGSAKLCAGQLSRFACLEAGLRHIWARVFSVYGPYDGPNTLISFVIQSLLKGNKPELTSCEQIWDYLFCKDAARAIMLLALSGRDGETYCLGSGNATPLKEYVEEISLQINPHIGIDFGKKPYAEHQVMHLQADITSLTNDTGFYPTISFSEGAARTIAWWKETQL